MWFAARHLNLAGFQTGMQDQLYGKDWIEFYDKWMVEKHYSRTFKILAQEIKKYNPSAKDVLELACGTGRYTRYLLRAGFKVKATDISADAIAIAKKRAAKADFEIADMATIRENQRFDVVTCLFESFRYNKSYPVCLKTLQNAYTALKPGGLFFCDFGIYPPKSKHGAIFQSMAHDHVKMSGGRIALLEHITYTKGNFDFRENRMTISKRHLFGKPTTVFTGKVERAPLLRIDQGQMRRMLDKAGFKVLDVISGFQFNQPSTYLFVAQRRLCPESLKKQRYDVVAG
jgi:SAM-dependent methyltransferase